jgi:hypothetical protein
MPKNNSHWPSHLVAPAVRARQYLTIVWFQEASSVYGMVGARERL